MSIQQILKKLKQAQEDSKIELALCDPKVLAGQTVRKNQGIENLKTLTKQYNTEIAKEVVPVFTNDQVANSPERVVYDANTFYQDMVKSVSSFVSGRMDPLNITQIREFMFKVAKDLDILEFNAIDYTNLFSNSMNPVQFAAKIKENFQKSKLDFFADLYLQKKVAERLLELNADGSFLPPTFILNALPAEYERISKVFSGVYTVQSQGEFQSTSNNLKHVVKDETTMGIVPQNEVKKVKKGKQL